MNDGAQRIHGLTVDQDVELHERRHAILRLNVVERRIPLRAALQLIKVVDNQFGERDLEAHHHTLLIEILHAVKDATLIGGEVHDGADVARWRHD